MTLLNFEKIHDYDFICSSCWHASQSEHTQIHLNRSYTSLNIVSNIRVMNSLEKPKHSSSWACYFLDFTLDILYSALTVLMPWNILKLHLRPHPRSILARFYSRFISEQYHDNRANSLFKCMLCLAIKRIACRKTIPTSKNDWPLKESLFLFVDTAHEKSCWLLPNKRSDFMFRQQIHSFYLS